MKESTRWWTVGAGAVMVLGSFLPWVQAGIFSVAGVSGDGVFTAIGGGVVVGIGVINRRSSRALGYAVSLLGIIGIAVTVQVMSNVSGLADPSDLFAASVGTGLLVTMLASFLAIFAGLAWARQSSKAEAEPSEHTDHGPSIADRLTELDRLLEQGVITSSERERRRAAILDET